jgi:hypothetical protein
VRSAGARTATLDAAQSISDLAAIRSQLLTRWRQERALKLGNWVRPISIVPAPPAPPWKARAKLGGLSPRLAVGVWLHVTERHAHAHTPTCITTTGTDKRSHRELRIAHSALNPRSTGERVGIAQRDLPEGSISRICDPPGPVTTSFRNWTPAARNRATSAGRSSTMR